jgi:hypothetical protein
VGKTETVRVHSDDMFDGLEPTDLSSLGHSMQTRQTVLARNSSYKIRQLVGRCAIFQPTLHESGASHSPTPPSITPPPAGALTFSFSSLIPTFYRPAASTARQFSTPLHHPASYTNFLITCTTTRTYASAPKKKKMPPKKAVKEEKLPLGRPGNNLKTGIVSERPARLCVVAFSH